MAFKKTVQLVVITGAAASILAGAFFLPLGYEHRWVHRITAGEKESVILQSEQLLTQTFQATPQRLSAINIFSTAAAFRNPGLTVRIRDEQGQELTQSFYIKDTYHEEDLRLTVLLRPINLQAKTPYTLEVSIGAGEEPLPLLTIRNEHYVNAELTLETEVLAQQDLPLELLTRGPLPFGARQGVLAGVVFWLGSYLIYLLPLTSRQRWSLAMFLVVVTIPLALAGFWFSKDELGISDWDYYFSLHHIWRQILVEHHQFPQWNPYTCGGTAALADPEFSLVTPSFLWEIAFGVPQGVRLAIFFSTIVGSLGTLQLARSLRLSWPAALLATLTIFLGSVNLLEIVEGHVNIFASMWIPWIFWSWLRAYRRVGSPVWCGIFLALTFLQGGIYLLMYTLLAFIVLPLLVAKPQRAVSVTVQAGLWALGLSAFKLIPVLLWLREFPDKAYAGSGYTLLELTDILFGRHLHGVTVLPEQTAGWHEYGAYIGYGAAVLALLGSSRIRQTRWVRAAIIAGGLALLLSSAGPLLEPYFDVLPWLPRSMISRVIFYAVIPIGLLAGAGLDVVRQRLKGGATVAMLVLGIVSVDLMSFSYQLSEQAFIVPHAAQPLPPAPYPIAFTGKVPMGADETGYQHTRAYLATLAGYGTLNYCSVLGPQSNVRIIEDESGSPFISVEANKGSARLTHWDPKTAEAEVTLTEPGDVIINTNYSHGWYVNGEPAAEVAGRVAARLPAGAHTLRFEYRTPGLPAGIAVSVITVTILLLLYIRRYRADTTNQSL